MPEPRFESLGIYLPERRLRSDELMKGLPFRNPALLRGITGIVERRVRAPGEDSVVLATRAAEACLARSSYAAEDLDIVVSGSITHLHPEGVGRTEPPTSHSVAEALGAERAQCIDLSNACAGMLTAAMVLDGLIRTGAVRRGLVVSGECITPIAESAMRDVRSLLDPQFASLTVGDAGAAFVLDDRGRPEERIDFVEMVTLAEHAELCIGTLNHDHGGFSMYSQAGELTRVGSGADFSRTVIEALARHGRRLDREDYEHVVFHQVTLVNIKKHMRYFQDPCGLDLPNALISVDECGNTASTSHFVALERALRSEEVKAGDRVLFLAQASGINLGVLSARLGAL